MSPWINLLKQHYWAGKRALQLLKAKEQGEDVTKLRKLLLEAKEGIARHQKQIADECYRLWSNMFCWK